MILEYKCSNFKSIKDEVIFSMLASSDTRYSEKLLHFQNKEFNRLSAVCGANGSGKSTLFDSLLFLASFATGELSESGDFINVTHHMLLDKDVTSKFFIQFEKNNIRYAYGIDVTRDKVMKEYLYNFKVGKEVLIFERDAEEYKFDENYKSSLEKFVSMSNVKRSFLEIVANFSNNEDIKNVFRFFKEDLVVYSDSSMDNWKKYSFYRMISDMKFKAMLVKIFNVLGVDVKDMDVCEDKILFDYGMFSVDLDSESNGIRKLFEILCLFLDGILNDKVLIWDGVDVGLHSNVLRAIVDIFNERVDSKAQFIFSTHDISILSLSVFRMDQIWFTELDKSERKTELYSLYDFKNVRNTDNVCKNYLEGRYGAVPDIIK